MNLSSVSNSTDERLIAIPVAFEGAETSVLRFTGRTWIMMKTTSAGISPPAFTGTTSILKTNYLEIANIGGGDMVAGGTEFIA